MQSFTIDHQPSAEAIAYINEQIQSFNIEQTGISTRSSVSLVLRDETGAIIAGINGQLWGNCCELQSLWVSEKHRGSGLGKQVLELAETKVKEQGGTVLTLASFSFQAPKFLREQGFDLVGVVQDYPSPYNKYFFRKKLA
ncbi:MAG: GNAT family N-acetyltransferase [Trueperaceae bacterium]|nr:GNAT family N-acetyltransferase [Trueperaceae bacterium]